MVRDSVQLETVVNTISHEYLLEFTSEYGISEMLHPELPRLGDRIVDFPEGKVDECVFPTAVEWRTNASKYGMSANGTYYVEAVRALDTHHLFSLIRAPNPTKVKTESRPRAPYELPLVTLTAPRVIEMDEPAAATDSFGVPSTIEWSPLDFAYESEASGRETAAHEMSPPKEVPITTAPRTDQAVETVAVEPPPIRESRKRGHEGIDDNALPKMLRRDHAYFRPSDSSCGGKSLAAMQLCLASNVFVSESVPADVSDPDPLAFADVLSPHPGDVSQSSQGVAVAGDPKSKNVSSPTEVGSPRSVYWPEWGVTNGSLLDTPEACQDLVDHAAPPGYFFELRHMHNEDFLSQYNINLSRQVAMGSQLRFRFEQEAKLLRKYVAQVACQDQGIQARKSKIKNLEALLETKAGMKRAAEEKSTGLSQELERMRRRWVIGHGPRLATMKCAESLEMSQAFADVVSAWIAKGMSEGLKHGWSMGMPNGCSPSRYIQRYATPRNPWACKEEIKLADAIAANIGRAEQQKRSRIVCRTHGVSSAHHVRSDLVAISTPIVVPQGLALLLIDAAMQTESNDA
nr:hypothetical protein [Tanacetum cinerariifolium]